MAEVKISTLTKGADGQITGGVILRRNHTKSGHYLIVTTPNDEIIIGPVTKDDMNLLLDDMTVIRNWIVYGSPDAPKEANS